MEKITEKPPVSFNLRQKPMPEEMHVLLHKYPRDSWSSHPGFKDKTEQWMAAHQMFRQLGALISQDCALYLDGQQDMERQVARLAYYGDALVRNLHGHHHFEDHSYFPELEAADPRFKHGLEILEKDHEALDVVLDAFTKSANRAIQLFTLDRQGMRDEIAAVHTASQTIESFLDRHLRDEEDLAVPIILHHRLRG